MIIYFLIFPLVKIIIVNTFTDTEDLYCRKTGDHFLIGWVLLTWGLVRSHARVNSFVRPVKTTEKITITNISKSRKKVKI